MNYILLYSDTKETIEDVLKKIYADFVENKLKDLLTKTEWQIIPQL